MIKLLAKIFIKDYKMVNDQKVRSHYGMMCAIIGIVTNLLICALKIVVGIISGCISITADGINNLTDGGSSVITLIGFKVASKPADKDHPFGHERFEYINGLVVSLIVLTIGVLLAKTSIEKIIEPTSIDLSFFVISLVVLVISILIKMWQLVLYNNCAKLIESPALKATAKDSLADILCTSVVLVSLIITKIWALNIDGYIGLAVAILIVYSAVKLILETMSPLIGEAPSKEFVHEVENKILSYDGILGIHDLVIHSYGKANKFISVHAEVDGKKDIIFTHEIVDKIEHDFLNQLGINLVIHMDPVLIDDEETNSLKKETIKIIKDIDERLSMHDFRISHGITKKVIFDIVVPAKFKMDDEKLISEIKNNILNINSGYEVIITIDKNYIGGSDE